MGQSHHNSAGVPAISSACANCVSAYVDATEYVQSVHAQNVLPFVCLSAQIQPGSQAVGRMVRTPSASSLVHYDIPFLVSPVHHLPKCDQARDTDELQAHKVGLLLLFVDWSQCAFQKHTTVV